MCFNIYRTLLDWIVTNLRSYNSENNNKRQNDRIYVPKTLKALKTSMLWIFLQYLSKKVIKTENVSCHWTLQLKTIEILSIRRCMIPRRKSVDWKHHIITTHHCRKSRLIYQICSIVALLWFIIEIYKTVSNWHVIEKA